MVLNKKKVAEDFYMYTKPHRNSRKVGRSQDSHMQTRNLVEGLHNFKELFQCPGVWTRPCKHGKKYITIVFKNKFLKFLTKPVSTYSNLDI